MNETIYWIIEYVKVLIGFGLVFFVWPMIVFRGLLKEKTRTFQFGFCVTVMTTLINFAVIFPGLFHILNVWVIRILFYGVFLFAFVRMLRIEKINFKKIKYTYTGTMGRKTLFREIGGKIGEAFKNMLKKIAVFFGDNKFVYIFLIVILLYSMLYFTWNAFQNYSYGASDMYTHNKWIYGLVEGEAYSAGIYPEGMHCFIYLLYALFGIRIYSSLLFVAGINIAVTLVSLYILFKEMFKWKYSPVLAVGLFSILDVKMIYPVLSVSRLAWTIPQEFGYPMIFLCGAFLLRYLKDEKRESWKKLFNENLVIFMLALSGTIEVHFYVTIMAFFVCLMIVFAKPVKVFKPKNLGQISLAILMGLFIAFVPMLAALATGKKFQGSVNWALSIIKNSVSYEDSGYQNNNDDLVLHTADEDGSVLNVSVNADPSDNSETESVNQIAFNDPDDVTVGNSYGVTDSSLDNHTAEIKENGGSVKTLLLSAVNGKTSRARKIKRSGNSESAIKTKLKKIYDNTYIFMNGDKRAKVLLIMQLVGFLIWLAHRIAAIFIKKNDEDYDSARYDGYLMIVLMGICFTLLNSLKSLGLPELLEAGRICAVTQMLALGVFFIPADLILSLPFYRLNKIVSVVLAAVSFTAMVVLTVKTGNYHGFLYYCLGRYNGAVKCTIAITDEVRPEEFTIVSTTDELYQIIQYGYHEELIDFVNSFSHEDSYTLPTKYVFIFVEKKPIQYPHYHFAAGPKWLALEKYPAYFGTYVSQHPDIIASEISEEAAEKDYGKFARISHEVYTNLELRSALESKAYAWCQKFGELYPGELHTYYEDDDFVCYYFEQNQRSIYELSIMKE